MWITKEWCSNYILITFHVLTHLQFTSFFKLKKFLLIFQSVLVPLFIQLLYYLSCLILYSLPFLSIDWLKTYSSNCMYTTVILGIHQLFVRRKIISRFLYVLLFKVYLGVTFVFYKSCHYIADLYLAHYDSQIFLSYFILWNYIIL